VFLASTFTVSTMSDIVPADLLAAATAARSRIISAADRIRALRERLAQAERDFQVATCEEQLAVSAIERHARSVLGPIKQPARQPVTLADANWTYRRRPKRA
jgi:hypothetical protein